MASSNTVATPDHKDLRLVLLKELGDALRARSEAEHLYAAAAVGSFGAVAWGVAAVQPEKYMCRSVYARPATVAAVGVVFVAVVVAAKIIREHSQYAKLRKQQARIARDLASLPGAMEIVPEDMQVEDAGPGYKWSLAVVAVAAVAATSFCLLLGGL